MKKKRIGIQAKLHALFVDMKLVIVGNIIPMKENERWIEVAYVMNVLMI